MQQAAVLGAGNIGRGFVGQLFCEAGWKVTFLEIDQTLIRALATDGSYPHVTVSNTESVRRLIGPVTAVDSTDRVAAVAVLVAADAAATALGARELPQVIPLLAEAIRQRIDAGRPPLNLLLCENLHGAAGIARTLLAEQLPDLSADVLEANIGLLETSIGRMIPAPDPSLLAVEPTLIRAEPYKRLPYDATAVRGEPLLVPGLIGITDIPFDFYADRKLYVHNMGHALTAYLGERAGVTYVWEAVSIPIVRYLVRAAMVESAVALSVRYGQPSTPLLEELDGLLHRFGNRALGDTVARVGRDPIRKTAAGDRLVGAYAAAVAQHVPTRHLSLAVAAGADALRRHEGWSDSQIREHLAKGIGALTDAQSELLAAQIAELAAGFDLQRQIDLIDATYEPARVL